MCVGKMPLDSMPLPRLYPPCTMTFLRWHKIACASSTAECVGSIKCRVFRATKSIISQMIT